MPATLLRRKKIKVRSRRRESAGLQPRKTKREGRRGTLEHGRSGFPVGHSGRDSRLTCLLRANETLKCLQLKNPPLSL